MLFLGLENDFKRRLQEYVAQLDAEKAALLATLEKELSVRQEEILETARRRIDDLNEEANRLKMVRRFIFLFLIDFNYLSIFRAFFVKLKLKAMLKLVII